MTLATFSPGRTVQLMLRKTGSKPGLYCTYTLRNSIFPSVGQCSGSGTGSTGGGGS